MFIFIFSGIRPVRKFPVNFEHPKNNNVQASTAATDPDPTMPSRMSAMLKSNPITLAQQEVGLERGVRSEICKTSFSVLRRRLRLKHFL